MLNAIDIEKSIKNSEADCALDEFAQAVKTGLSRKNKAISSKYLYDQRGSELFVQITRLNEYYLSDCEEEIFIQQADDIVQAIKAPIRQVVELGCGDGFKTERLLRMLAQEIGQLKFVPVDISETAIECIKERMARAIPDITFNEFIGDYTIFLDDPARHERNAHQLVLFLGSNIGNFSKPEALAFLQSINRYCQPGDYLLVGMDLKKNIDVMHAAYNDTAGITRAFNLNLLERINRELDANFDANKFYHHGHYNAELGAMQSFLVSQKLQTVSIKALDMQVEFDLLEPIHVEDSHKYSLQEISHIAGSTGFQVKHIFSDSRDYFVDVLLQKPR